MKKNIFFLTLLLFSYNFLFAQQVDYQIITEKGEIIQSNKNILDSEEDEDNIFISFEPSKQLEDIKMISTGKNQQNFDPGAGQEGDYMQAAKFSPDGTKFFIVNRQTYNVTVFDWETKDTVANIPIGNGGVNIAINNELAVITCLFDNYVTIVDLSDYSTVDVPTNERPANVQIHPNGNFAYVGCETNYVCDVIDLTTNTVVATITDFPVYAEIISWSTGSGRNFVKYNEFFFTYGGDYIVVAAHTSDNLLKFYSTNTNTLEGTVPIDGCRNVGISPDSTIVFTTGYYDHLAYRVDVDTRTIIGNPVAIPDGPSGNPGIYSNPDGTKIYLGNNGNHGTLIDFIDEESVTFPQTYSAFWCSVSYDHQYVVHGNYNFAIINFDTESVEDIYSGYTQSFGIASPTDYHALAFDPLRMECIHLFDFTTPSNITKEGAVLPADNYEGDAPIRVQVSTDGTKAVLANHLSQSVTIFNITNSEVDTIFNFPVNADIKSVAITHNSEYAVVSFDDYYKTVIIDLTTNEIVKEVVGSSGHTIRITPDDEYAYISNIGGTDKINVIRLDGADSYYVSGITTGSMGVFWAHYGIYSDIRIDPTGNYCVAAVSFDDKVKIIDISTNTIVQELTGFDFPFQLAFNNTGDKLAVTNKNGNSVSIINFNGASSSVQGTYNCGDTPTRVAFNSVTNEFFVCNNNGESVVKINHETGAIIQTIFFNDGYPVKVDFDSEGNSIILVNSSPHQIVNQQKTQYFKLIIQ